MRSGKCTRDGGKLIIGKLDLPKHCPLNRHGAGKRREHSSNASPPAKPPRRGTQLSVAPGPSRPPHRLLPVRPGSPSQCFLLPKPPHILKRRSRCHIKLYPFFTPAWNSRLSFPVGSTPTQPPKPIPAAPPDKPGPDHPTDVSPPPGPRGRRALFPALDCKLLESDRRVPPPPASRARCTNARKRCARARGALAGRARRRPARTPRPPETHSLSPNSQGRFPPSGSSAQAPGSPGNRKAPPPRTAAASLRLRPVTSTCLAVADRGFPPPKTSGARTARPAAGKRGSPLPGCCLGYRSPAPLPCVYPASQYAGASCGDRGRKRCLRALPSPQILSAGFQAKLWRLACSVGKFLVKSLNSEGRFTYHTCLLSPLLPYKCFLPVCQRLC